MFQTKVVKKIKTHILCPITFFFLNRAVSTYKEITSCDNVWEGVSLHRNGQQVYLKLRLCFHVETFKLLESRFSSGLFTIFSHSSGFVVNMLNISVSLTIRIYFWRYNRDTDILLNTRKLCFLYFIQYLPHLKVFQIKVVKIGLLWSL